MIHREVAIIGYALSIPGVESEEDIWNAFVSGADLVSDFPASRIDTLKRSLPRLRDGVTADRFLKGAYFEDVAGFDHRFFNMSLEEACLTDPCQRLFLSVAYSAVEHAGYGGEALKGTRTGVFAGFGDTGEYLGMLRESGRELNLITPDLKPLMVVGSIGSLVPGRVCHFLDLKGPGIVLDTLCSSSLVAVHQACQAIRSGELDMALAGGIKLELCPLDDAERRYGFEAAEGVTRPFDERASGYARSEAAGVVVLKALDDALRDGDCVHAVVKGSAYGHGGTAMSVVAPSYEAVERTVLDALDDAGVSAENVSYIEANGTGSKMTDAMELFGLHRAFRHYTSGRQYCGIGSFKSNMGHPVQASGIVALIRAVMALKRRRLPPTIHFGTPNKIVNFPDSPFYINDRARDCATPDEPLVFGVNAMGMSGTTCHLIVGEAPTPAAADDHPSSPAGRLFVLSARSAASLDALVGRFIDLLASDRPVNLRDMCYTLQTGRGHHETRLAIRFSDRADLLDKLRLVRGGGAEADVRIHFRTHRVTPPNQAKTDAEEITRPELKALASKAGELAEQLAEGPEDGEGWHRLCELYVSGAAVPWHVFYRRCRPNRAALPTYAYELVPCWYDRLAEMRAGDGDGLAMTAAALEEMPDLSTLSTTEQAVLGMWRQLLRRDSIRPDEHFFEAGGDSLLAFRLLGMIRDEFLVTLDIAQVLENPTVSAIAELIDAARREQATGGPVPEMRKVEERDGYALSANQLRLFAIHELEGIGTSYNLPFAMECGETVDFGQVVDAFRQLVERHEILRTHFGYGDGQPRQFVNRSVELRPEMYTEGEDGTFESIVERFVRPFDLGRAPLFRLGLVTRKEKPPVLLFDIHHIIADRTSIDIMLRELAERVAGRTPEPPDFQYKEYADWERRYFETDEFRRQEEYWTTLYASPVRQPDLPVDYPRPALQSFEGDRLVSDASPELAGRLFRASREYGVTPFVCALAAYLILLHKYTGGEDLVVGTPVLGRTAKGTERMLGMFANTLALRNRVSGSLGVGELIEAVRESSYAAFARQHYPLHRLLQKIGGERQSNRNPLFDTCFAWIGREHSVYRFSGLELRPVEMPLRSTLFDISFNVYDAPDGLRLETVYASKLFRKETIALMQRHYGEIVGQMDGGGDRLVDQITLTANFRKVAMAEDAGDFDF